VHRLRRGVATRIITHGVNVDRLQLVDILVVDDNAIDAEMTMRALKRINLANKVTWLQDGAAALDFVFCRGQYVSRVSKNPCLILLDIRMPKLSGIEVLRQIKSDERTRTIPVVILTSSAEERDMAEAYAIGANSYLVKPVDAHAFLDVVARAGLYWAIHNRVPS